MTPFEGETGKDVIIKNASNNPHTPGKVEVNDEVYSQGTLSLPQFIGIQMGKNCLKH
jgi:hypothetical protein